MQECRVTDDSMTQTVTRPAETWHVSYRIWSWRDVGAGNADRSTTMWQSSGSHSRDWVASKAFKQKANNQEQCERSFFSIDSWIILCPGRRKKQNTRRIKKFYVLLSVAFVKPSLPVCQLCFKRVLDLRAKINTRKHQIIQNHKQSKIQDKLHDALLS